MAWIQIVTIIGISISMFIFLSGVMVWALGKNHSDIQKINDDILSINARVDQINARVDQIYSILINNTNNEE